MTSTSRPLRYFMQSINRYRIRFYLSVGSSIANKVFDLMPPLLVGWVIDSLRGQPPHWIREVTGTNDPLYLAFFLSGLAVLIFALESLFQWGYQYGFMTLAQAVQHDLRLKVYAHVQSRELAFFENHRLGDTLSMMNDDVNQLERFLNSGLNEFIQVGVLIVVAGGILFDISWQLAMIGMAPIPFILWGSWLYHKTISPRYQAVRAKVGALSSRLENNMAGIQVIQSFSAEKFELDRVAKASQDYRQINTKAIRLFALYTPIIRMAVVVGFAGVLLVGSYWVLQNKGILTVGELVLFAMMTERLLWPLTRMGPTVDDYERATASANRIFTLLSKPSTIQDPASPKPPFKVKGSLQFENVTFAYEGHAPTLSGLSLTIHPGLRIGIAGPTGSGKSTFIKLLMRFYDPISGCIRLDDVPIDQLSIRFLRQQLALVSQDVYLFHGTIFENIAYGLERVSQAEVEHAANLAELHSFVTTLPQGYQTVIGERGLKLSGGQRQRLSIARAILKNAPIMVFDEATSSVDTETEKAIQTHLDTFTKGKTAIIVAHRLSTIRHADRILVISKGKLAEQGTHDELILKQGIYSDLWKVQIGE